MNTPANIRTQAAAGSEDDGLVLGDLIRLLFDKIWWVLGIAAAVVLAALAYVTIATPIYSANALIQVEQPDSNSSPLASSTALSSFSGTLPTASEIEVIQSRDVLGPVVDQYKMAFSISPQRFPILGSIAAHFARPGQLSRPWLGMNSYAWGGEIADISSIVVPQALESQKLTLVALGDGRYALQDPEGRRLVEGIVGQPAQSGGVQITVNRLVANAGTRFNVVRWNQLDAIQGFGSSVKVGEQGKQTGIIAVSMNGTDPARTAELTNAVADSYLSQHLEMKQEEASRMLTFLNGELPRLKGQLESAEARLSAYQQKSGSFQPSTEAGIYLQGSIEYERQLTALRLQETELLQKFTPDHPMVQAIQRQIGQIAASKSSFDARFRGMPVNEANALSLQRDAKVSQDIYELLLNKVQELSLTRAGTVGNVRILDRALRPAEPIKPKKSLIMIASVFLGLILGSLFVFARRQLTLGIEDPDVIENHLGLPILGAISLNAAQVRWDSSYRRDRHGRREILAKSFPKDPSVEALRSFRTSLQFAVSDARNNILSMSGPVPGTGKSFISVNLATLLAEAGKRVLLIDGDMRRGHLNEYFGITRAPGLSEMLQRTLLPSQVINQTDVPGLHTIWTGAIPENPAELLELPETRGLFESLGRDYDMVIIDTPPVLAVTDATIIGSIAGSSFLVLRSGIHSEREIALAIRKISQSGTRIVGGIFNAMPMRKAKHGKFTGGGHNYVYSYESEKN
ncbi:polysaccharide biosynthesis tyrosine autokinase [Robbsia sp. Bb-Pol-6]|uniref:Polysaccharide biosynthesis tyrosine autokinase n=1 Tax=Robbsia betulipollinis TaxID=2981849 RepID=A0ABT3ZTJ7_9BURK|nr:polysaccharide biosynthesis tyrosine autokinase [Robbsia betulipollinis]MCY0389782.1 polysaccharide biosynthesis tyrosine autokinase [Robbsia betulipollinis]